MCNQCIIPLVHNYWFLFTVLSRYILFKSTYTIDQSCLPFCINKDNNQHLAHTMCSVGEGSMCLDVFCEQKKHKLESRDRQKYLGLTYLGGIFLLPRWMKHDQVFKDDPD